MAAVEVTPVYGVGAPVAELTISDLGFTDSLVSLWRTADGERAEVRGYRRVRMIDTARVTDHDVPYGRPVTYEVEVISGPNGPSRTTSAPVVVESDSAWIMDPLDPSTAVQIHRRMTANGETTFEVSAMAAFEYAADVSMIQVMGMDRPMMQMGQRAAARGIDLTMITDMASQNAKLRRLFRSAGQLLVRVPASWTTVIEGTCFIAVPSVKENPIGAAHDSPLTVWELTATTVAAPVIKVLTATFTYGDVKVLFATYQQKADALAPGATYLDDSKAPFG